MQKLPIVCLLGPTGSGKTALAVNMVKQFPCEIISVDSAMVYRGLDIGSAKPSADILKIAPHRLIDLVDPREPYSAGQFRVQALQAIDEVIANGKIPLLTGGTMLYFRVLQQGLAALPAANQTVRTEIAKRALEIGWEKLHAELAQVDPLSASRIHANDSQRIQRALEVFMLTGKTISAWQQEDTQPLSNYCLHNLIITPADRTVLHARIAARFEEMLAAGFVDEVQRLYARDDLSPDLPAIRSVGYSQIWSYLAGEFDYETMCEKAVTATRQLAKRQLTWLRSWPNAIWFHAESELLTWCQKNIFSALKEE